MFLVLTREELAEILDAICYLCKVGGGFEKMEAGVERRTEFTEVDTGSNFDHLLVFHCGVLLRDANGGHVG